jgi:hypothetical protein
MDDFVDTLLFDTHVCVASHSEGARYLYRGQALIDLTRIALSAVIYFDEKDSMQPGDSFKGTWPSVFIVPQGIQVNDALSSGLLINLSEDSRLSQHVSRQSSLSHLSSRGFPHEGTCNNETERTIGVHSLNSMSIAEELNQTIGTTECLYSGSRPDCPVLSDTDP